MEIIAYNTDKDFVGVAVRNFNSSQDAWGIDAIPTNLPNGYSHLNAGILPDHRTYFLNNPMVPQPSHGRDPITLAPSKDGLAFQNIGVIMTCTDLGPTSTCTPRFDYDYDFNHNQNHNRAQARTPSKIPGPSYPQGVALTDPAPKELQALYVAASNNMEDIWVVRIEYDMF